MSKNCLGHTFSNSYSYIGKHGDRYWLLPPNGDKELSGQEG